MAHKMRVVRVDILVAFLVVASCQPGASRGGSGTGGTGAAGLAGLTGSAGMGGLGGAGGAETPGGVGGNGGGASGGTFGGSAGGSSAGTGGSASLSGFFVSPAGKDTNAGTADAPFQTITRARDAVRAVSTNMTGESTSISEAVHTGSPPNHLRPAGFGNERTPSRLPGLPG